MKNRKDTWYWRSKCGVGLYLVECFEEYHTKLVYTQVNIDEVDSDDTVESESESGSEEEN